MNEPSDICTRCQSPTYYGPGAGPHAARVNCTKCGRLIRWVARSEAPAPEVIAASLAAQEGRERRERPTLF